MITDFDDQLSDLKQKIIEFEECSNLEIQGLLLDPCYNQLNALLRQTKEQKSYSLSQQSKVLKLKSLLDKAYSVFLQEINFYSLVRDATQLDQIYKQKIQNEQQINILIQSILNAVNKINQDRLTAKQLKLFNDALNLTAFKKDNVSNYSQDLDDNMIAKIESLNNDDQFMDIVQTSQRKYRQSVEIVSQLKSCEVVEDHIEQSVHEQKIIEENGQMFTQNRSIFSRSFKTVLKMFQPFVDGLFRLMNLLFRSKKVTLQTEAKKE